jgi:RHS repeat-associated protein
MFFTGKPQVEGLGYAFLFRNYRADLGKWQTADPLGYPDGWNNLAYVNNGVTSAIDTNGGFISFGFAAIGTAISTAGYATSKLLTGKPITASGLAGAAAGGFVAGAIVGAITTLDPSAGIIAIGLTSAVAATGGKIVNNVISNQSYQNCTDGVAQAAIIAAVTGGISQGLDWSALANNAASLGTGVTSDVFDYVYEQITSALNDLNTTSQEHYNDIFQELNTIAPSRISSNETFNFSGYVAE